MPAREPARTASAYQAASLTGSAFTLAPCSRVPGRQVGEQLVGGVGDDGAGTEDRGGTGRAQLVVVLRRDDAADHHHDVVPAVLGEGGLERRDEGEVTGRQ